MGIGISGETDETDVVAQHDVIVVGAGMAGLLAALRIGELRSGTRVLVVDAGRPMAERERYGSGDWGGFGGAGLFLGGRVYIGPATIPVLPPTTLPAGAAPILDGAAYEARAREVNALLDALGATAPLRERPDERILAAIAQAEAAGLEYVTSYPARFLSIDERLGVLRGLRGRLANAGVTFRFGARVTAIRRDDQRATGYRVRVAASEGSAAEAEASFTARALLLAPGRYGAEWLVAMARDLDVRLNALPPAFGVRLELPQAAYAPLTAINPDPRLQRALPSDALAQTYATIPGGRVTAVERYGRLVASAVPLAAAEKMPTTTLSVLVRPGVEGASADAGGAWAGAETYGATLNARYPGRLVVQRMADVRAGRTTTADGLAAGPVTPTHAEAVPGRLDDVYPAVYWQAYDDLLGRIARLAPGVLTEDALAYGPAEEHFWHFPTDAQLQTNQPGVFVAGDAAGLSQGIVQAAVTGLLAGEGVAAYLAG
ncbi:MAG TPA: FAD-binding protein [Ktedonobacterales bacterium]